MAKVHLIWWGKFRDYETCLQTANDVVLTCLQHKVELWVRREEVAKFKRHAQPRLKINGILSFREIAQTRTDVLTQKFFTETIGVLQRLDRHNAYAAVKDLMSMLIIYLHGGLCMDTTAKVLTTRELVRCRGLRMKHALSDLGNQVLIPKISDDTWQHQPFLQTAQAILFGRDREFSGHERTFVDVPAIDVWALYGPVGHPIFETMIDSYVSRANRVGLNRSGQGESLGKVGEFDGKDLGVMLMHDPSFRGTRNDLIGNLVVRSVFDGICSAPADSWGLWDTVAIEPNKHYLVPQLGIGKVYKNSWR